MVRGVGRDAKDKGKAVVLENEKGLNMKSKMEKTGARKKEREAVCRKLSEVQCRVKVGPMRAEEEVGGAIY